ncbi:MAG: hypothetical protein Q9163_001706 [Psora crenata]
MEPPYKKTTLSGYQITDADLRRKRAQNDRRLKSIFESIFEKYEKSFEGVADEIDLGTGEIVVNNGHILGMRHEKDAGGENEGPLVDTGYDSSSEIDASDTITVSFDDTGSVISNVEADGQFLTGNMSLGGEQNNTLVGSDTAAGAGYDEYEDELGDGSSRTTRAPYEKIPSHDYWQLPKGILNLEAENAINQKWSAPPLPPGPLRHRPLHRRITLPTPISLGSTSTIHPQFYRSASIWAGKAGRPRRKEVINVPERHRLNDCRARSNRCRTCTTWTSASARTLKYPKNYTQLTYKEIAKYFPNQTEQSLACYWEDIQDHDDQKRNQTLCSPCLEHHLSLREPSLSSPTDCANDNTHRVTEHHEPHHIVPSDVIGEASSRDERRVRGRETLGNSLHGRPRESNSTATLNAHLNSTPTSVKRTRESTSYLPSPNSTQPDGYQNSPIDGTPLGNLNKEHFSGIRFWREVPDSDSAVASLSPLVPTGALTSTLIHSSHSFKEVPIALPKVCLSKELAPAIADSPPVAPLLPDLDLQACVEARRMAEERPKPSPRSDMVIESSLKDVSKYDEVPAQVPRPSKRQRSNTARQRIHVVIPIRRQRNSPVEAPLHNHPMMQTTAHIARECPGIRARASRPPTLENDRKRATSMTDPDLKDSLTATHRVVSPQPSQMIAPTRDRTENAMHAPPIVRAGANSVGEAAVPEVQERGNREVNSLNNFQPKGRNIPMPQKMFMPAAGNLSVASCTTSNENVKVVNGTTIASILLQRDDDSEDDLSMSHSVGMSRTRFKAKTPRSKAMATSFLALVNCSDDELAC